MPARRASTPGGAPTATPKRRSRSAGDLVVRRVARNADDGYEHELVPGLRASADAVRLADELAFAAVRLEELSTDPPGPLAHATAAATPDEVEEALWTCALIAYLSPLEGVEAPFAAIEAVRVPWAGGDLPELDGVATGPRTAHVPARGSETLAAYRGWAERNTTQHAGLAGEASWSPQRRFDRAYERLALPGLGRTARYELLVLAGRLGLVDLEPGSLALSDATAPVTIAAKRVFGIGETVLLARRASELAQAAEVPLGTLDLALQNWAQPASSERMRAGSALEAAPAERVEAIARVLGA